MVEDLENSATAAPESLLPERQSRLSGLDLARGLAYFGMVAVNLHLVMTWGRSSASLVPAWLETGIESLFGRAAAAFVLIAGVGLSLRYRPSQAKTAAPRPGVRLSRFAFLLFLFVAILGSAFHLLRDRLTGGAAIGGLGQRADWLGLIQDFQAFVAAPWRPETQTFLIVSLLLWFMLALLLLVRNTGPASPRGELCLRALFLSACGYLWQPIWSGDILHFYGLWLLLAAVVLRLPTFLLVFLTLLCGGGALGLHLVWNYGEHWSPTLEHPQFWTLNGQLRDLLFDGWHPLFPWFGFLSAGLILGRMRLDRLRAPIGALVIGSLLVFGAGPAADWTTAATIEASRLAPAFEPASPELQVPTGPSRPGWVRPGRVQVDAAITDRSLIGAAEFVARQLADEPVRTFSLSRVDGKPRLLLQLRPGVTEKERDALAGRLLPWYFGQTLNERPIWPENLNTLALQVPLKSGDLNTTVYDREEDQSLPFAQEVGLLFSLKAIPPGPFFFLQALGSALMLVASCLLLMRLRPLQRLAHPIIQTGKMAFTLYLLHVLLGMGILDLLKLLHGQNLPFTALVILVINLLSMAFACAWLALWKRGPVEALMRWLCR